MNRKAGRQLAKTTLDALTLFEAVLQGPPVKFGGVSPLVVITSRSMALTIGARELETVVSGLTVSIYVRCDPNDESAAEDALDDLTAAAVVALAATDDLFIAESSADPASGNLRDVDRNGTLYRVERIPITVFDEKGY